MCAHPVAYMKVHLVELPSSSSNLPLQHKDQKKQKWQKLFLLLFSDGHDFSEIFWYVRLLLDEEYTIDKVKVEYECKKPH